MAYRKRIPRTADERIDVASMRFLDAMYAMSHDLKRTRHLKPLHEVAESLGRRESRFLCLTVPPRFGKTATLVHMVAWLLTKYPKLKIAYCTYSQMLSNEFSRQVRLLVEALGFEFSSDTNRQERWMNIHGGGLLATGLEGSLTGLGANLLIVDDPIMGHEQAMSLAVRDKVFNWMEWVGASRLQAWDGDEMILPSAIVVQTRWHTDDLVGRLLAGKLPRQIAWEYIHLRPIVVDDKGVEHSIWEERWPLTLLQSIRGDGTQSSWMAQYEGEPMAEGSTMFGTPAVGEFPGEVAA